MFKGIDSVSIRRFSGCKWTKTEFVVVDPKEVVTFEAELAKDVITLMTVFCARLYSRRARHRKKAQASSIL